MQGSMRDTMEHGTGISLRGFFYRGSEITIPFSLDTSVNPCTTARQYQEQFHFFFKKINIMMMEHHTQVTKAYGGIPSKFWN